MEYYNLLNLVQNPTTTQVPERNMIDVKLDMSHFDRNYFKNNIPNIPYMDEHTLSTIIKNNIDIICNDILRNDRDYASLFTNYKFISAFIKAINSVPNNYLIQMACNKITYDYFTSENPETEIKQKYLDMSRTVNKDAIYKLISIGLDELTACNLALCRYSSSKEMTNAKRLNFAMCNKDPEVMNEQRVIWVYEKLFTRISDLFNATMLEYYTQGQQAEFGENFIEIYGTISLAVLTIVNNMPSDKILQVIKNYYTEWVYKGKPPVRFSLRALSADYQRITRIVEYLITNQNIDIP